MTAAPTHPADKMRDTTVSHSLLYMWRTIIAVAHADGVMHENEIAHFERVISGLKRAQGLTAEQEAILRSDMATAQNVSQMLSHINDPAVRANIFHFGGLLARADGNLHPDEDALLRRLHADQMAGLDMEEIRKSAREYTATQLAAHDVKIDSQRPVTGMTGALDELLMYLGIDVLRL